MRKFIVISIVLLMLAGFAITPSAEELVVGRDHILVGELTVAVDASGNLVVTYNITDPEWELGDTHLYVETSPPAKSAPGQFPYGPEDADIIINGVSVKYTIPLNSFTGPLYIAAHAVVTNTCDSSEETAWARVCLNYAEDFMIRPGKNWASYFIFTVVP